MLHTVAHHLGCTAGTFTHILGDVHIYENHFEQVKLQLEQTILESPTIKFNIPPKEDFNYTFEDYSIVGYKHAGKNPASVSVQGKPGTGIKYESKNWIENKYKDKSFITFFIDDNDPNPSSTISNISSSVNGDFKVRVQVQPKVIKLIKLKDCISSDQIVVNTTFTSSDTSTAIVEELPYNNQVIIPIDIFKEDYDRILKPYFEEKVDLSTINENTEILVKNR